MAYAERIQTLLFERTNLPVHRTYPGTLSLPTIGVEFFVTDSHIYHKISTDPVEIEDVVFFVNIKRMTQNNKLRKTRTKI